MTLQRSLGWQRGEAALDELLGVQRPVEVPAAGHRLGQHHPRGVHSLPDVGQVDSAGDLLDQHRSEPFRPDEQQP